MNKTVLHLIRHTFLYISRRCCRTYESIPTNTIPHLIFCRIPVQNFNLCWLKHISRRCCRTYESIPTNTIPHLIFCRIPVQKFNLCWLAEEKKYLRGIWIFSKIDQYEQKCIYAKQTHLISLYMSSIKICNCINGFVGV